MAPFLFYIGLPLALIVVLALLPTGPVALAGLLAGVAAVLSSLVWAADDGTGFGNLLSGVLAMAVSLAALVQLSRHQRAGAKAGVMAVIVACLAVLATISIWKMLQV